VRAIISCEADAGTPGDFWMVRQSVSWRETGLESAKPTSGPRRWESAVANDFKVARHRDLEGTFAYGRAYHLMMCKRDRTEDV
jgi:hypothetical protein